MMGDVPRSERNAKVRPIQEGAYVLANSRAIMYDILRKIDPTQEDLDRAFYYTDTDSIIVHSEFIPLIEDEMHEDALGKLSNDLKGEGKVVEAYFISPKLYCLVYVVRVGCEKRECKFIGGKEGEECPDCGATITPCAVKVTMKSKGVRDYCMEESFYKDLAEGKVVSGLSFDSLKKTHLNLTHKDLKEGRGMFTLSNNKITRSLGKSKWEGRYKVSETNVTLPWGHCEIPDGEKRVVPTTTVTPAPLSETDLATHYLYLFGDVGKNKGYVGYTVNHERREQQHRGEIPGGAEHTKEWGADGSMLLVVTGFKCERDAKWAEHVWKGKEDLPRAERHGGTIPEKLDGLKALLTNAHLGPKLKNGVITIDWLTPPTTLSTSVSSLTSHLPLVHSGAASVTTPKRKKRQLAPRSAKKGPQAEEEEEVEESEDSDEGGRLFEDEAENDDDVPIYDSDNDPDAEAFVPLPEDYDHGEVREGEENEMDDFVVVDDDEYEDESSEWSEVDDSDYFDMYTTE